MGQVNHWPRVERRQREYRKRAMRAKGIKPAKKQWAVCVETTAIEIPKWALEKSLKAMSSGEHHVWFRGRKGVHAKLLAFQDEQAGGTPEMTKVEWRLCPVCGRVLLALEAEARRHLDESDLLGRTMPCGGECA